MINHCSGEHVGLLVYGLFNAAIPAEALKSHYYWDINQLLWTPKIAKKSKKGQNVEKEKKIELVEDHDVVSAPFEPLQLGLRLAFRITSIDCIQETVGFQGSLLD